MNIQNDKTAVEVIMLVIGVLILVAIVFFIGANMIASSLDAARPMSDDEKTAIAQRIEPVGQVAVADTSAGQSAQVLSAKEIVEKTCFACHGTGALNAPKVGDQAAWSERLAKGMDAVLKNAINGLGAMPPRGGSSLSDEELKKAIEYMAGQ